MARRCASQRGMFQAASLILLALSCTHMAQVAKAAALNSTTDNSNPAKSVADQLIASFGGSPDALAQLKQQATLVLQALGGAPASGASATGGTQDNTAAPSPSPPASMSPAELTTLMAALQKLDPQDQQMAAEATLKAANSNGLSSSATPAAATPAAGLAASLLQSGGLLGMFQSSLEANSSSPKVQAADGPSLSNAFSPLGTGDNLLEFRKRVSAVKEWYKEARTYLHIDDAVRIGGYIATLESLGISFISAFPIAELSFFVANLSLGAAILNLLAGIFYTVASTVGLTGSIITLQQSLPNPPPITRSTTTSTSTVTDYASSSSLSQIVNNKDLVNQLLATSGDLSSQLLPWVLGGGALAPLALATDVMNAASDSLTRLNNWVPPVGLATATGK